MKNFSQIIKESHDYSSETLLQSEITKYVNKVKKDIPVDVQKAIYLTAKYTIDSAEQLEQIRTATKTKLAAIANELNMPLKELEDLWALMKSIKSNYKLMPQYMSRAEREMIEAGKMALNDLTIDLKTASGRNAAAKVYTPLVYKIVTQELPKHPNMSRSEMISSGMLGLTAAMNDWKPEPDKKTGKVVPFKTYAGYRILQQIQNDANELYQDFAGRNSYNIKKDMERYGAGVLNAISLDGITGDRDADDFSQDRIAALGVADKPDSSQEEKKWNQLFKALETKFSQKDMDIFYRYFGINGRKRETGEEIARSYGTTAQNINNGYLSKVLKFIKGNKVLKDILMDIRDIYTEALMAGMIGMSKSQILEVFASNDIYILLSESTRWEDKAAFGACMNHALNSFAWSPSSYNTLIGMVLGEFTDLDKQVRKNNKLIREFLSVVHPTKSFNSCTDGDLIEYMTEIQEYCHKYNIDSSYFNKR